MTRRTHRWALAAMAVAWHTHAQPLPDEEDTSGAAAGAMYSAALTDRFVACLGAEGHTPAPDDRAVIEDATRALATPLARAMPETACEEENEDVTACAAALRALSCEALAARMQSIGSRPQAPPPAWAQGYARALSERVGQCYLAEQDAATLSLEDSAALEGFRAQLSQTLGVLTQSGRCTVDENAVPGCGSSVRNLSCDALAARVDAPMEGFGQGVTPACAAMLRCNVADSDAARDPPEDAAEVLAESP